MRLNTYHESKYNDLRIIHYELNCRLSKDELLVTPAVGVIRRKNVSDVGKRYLESIITNALDEVDAEYSTNSADSAAVLRTITNVISKKIKKMNNVVSDFFQEEETDLSDEEDDSEVIGDNSVEKEIAVEMKSFPVKSIKYNLIERENVIALFKK